MTELGSLLADTVGRLLTALATKELIESAEQGAWPEKLWRALEEGGLTLDGAPAWMLRGEAFEEGRAFRLKAVTRVAAGCTDDFLLLSPGELASHEAAFDRWWASYRAGSPG